MNYAEIKSVDIANGEGIRVSLFVSGCTHHCKGCFNQMTWDFDYGKPFTAEVEQQLLNDLDPSFITGLTLLGGEPMEPVNQRALLPFLKQFKEKYPRKTLWIYSGYLFDRDLTDPSGRAYVNDVTKEILSMTDILVDGPFVESQKDISLVFRGSSNQRIIRVPESLSSGEIVLWQPPKHEI